MNHENTKGRKLEKVVRNKKDCKLIFLISNFRDFVIN